MRDFSDASALNESQTNMNETKPNVTANL